MIINNKFDYKLLTREEINGSRKYNTPDGKKLVSGTTILSRTKDMSYLKEWRAAVGEAEATRIVTESSGLGNEMHKLLEDFVLGREMKGQFMSMTLAKLIIKKGLVNVNEVWGTEVALYSSELYAGTADLVGLHNGVPSIMDFKNSRQEKTKEMIEDYRAQLAAYALAHNEMYGTNINKGVIMMATRDGKYQEFIFEGYEFTECINLWLAALDKYYRLHRDDK
jgi:hypothetical protein